MTNQRAAFSFPQGIDFGTIQRAAVDSTLVVLVADVVNGGGESRYGALRVPGAAGGYQVPTGKTLYISKIQTQATVASVTWLTGSGSVDAGNSQVAAPATTLSEDSRTDGVSNGKPTSPTALTVLEFQTFVSVAASLYPFVRSLTASSTFFTTVYGVLV